MSLFGGVIGSVVGNVVGGLVSSLVGSTLNSMMSQFGMNSLAGAFSNIFMESLSSALKDIINDAPLPKFMQDTANETIDNIVGSNKQDTSPECQEAARNSDMGDAMDRIAYSMAQQAADEAERKCNGGEGSQNWLVALAGALAEVQAHFLDEALKNMETMKNNKADVNDTDEQSKVKRDEFLMAQSEYQANIQMFNMMANMTATSLKSLGEGLTAIARKQ